MDELRKELKLYKDARDAILTGAQSYTINGRSLSRADLRAIEDSIARLETRIARLSGTSKGGVKAPMLW